MLITTTAIGSCVPIALFLAFVAGAPLDGQWVPLSGEWKVLDQHLTCEAAGSSVCVPWAPERDAQSITGTVRIDRRIDKGTWAFAGIGIRLDEANYWRLELVEGPDGRRYADMVESSNGQWQAQASGPGKLTEAESAEMPPWEYNRDYTFRFTVDPDRVAGTIEPATGGGGGFRKTFLVPAGVSAVTAGRPALYASGMAAAFSAMNVTADAQLEREVRYGSTRIGVLCGMGSEAVDTLAQRIADSLSRPRWSPRMLTASELADPGVLRPGTIDILVLPDARTFPAPAVDNLYRFLRRRGKLIAVGLPALSNLVWPDDGRWVSRAEALAQAPETHPIFELTPVTIGEWVRGAADMSRPASRELDAAPPGVAGGSIHVRADLRGWDVLIHDTRDGALDGESPLTSFWAKGSPETPRLLIEWQERDGSRWTTRVELTTEWKRYVLAPEDLEYWPDNPSSGRGGATDHLVPENVARFSVGLAAGHGGAREGAQEYWIAGLAAAKRPPGLKMPEIRPLDGLTPWYKCYPLGPVSRFAVPSATGWPQQSWIRDLGLAPGEAVASRPRMQGFGGAAGRPVRFVPLVVAEDGRGRSRGSVVSAYVGVDSTYGGAVWAAVGLEPFEAAHSAGVATLVAALAKRLASGLFVLNAGTEHFSYFVGEEIGLVARLARFDRALAPGYGHYDNVALRMEIHDGRTGAKLHGKIWFRGLRPFVIERFEDRTGLRDLKPGLYTVTAELVDRNTVVDRITHEFSVVEDPADTPDSEIVRVRDGEFVIDGRRWHPHGVNYWPSYVTGIEAPDWVRWLSPAQYDPATVDRDLEMLESLGVNSVSITFSPPDDVRSLHDFLARCHRHRIRVSLFTPHTHPLAFEPEAARQALVESKLYRHPDIWTYDIAWEPHVGRYADRCRLDPLWQQWLIEQYGAVELAEADWGFAVPRTSEGGVTGPSDNQITNDGDWARMVAAYRRFLDDTISRGYGRVCRLIRSIDPSHLIGARSGYGGTGGAGVDVQMPFDLIAGAAHLDYISPEAYNLSGDWSTFQSGGFTTAYARWAGNGKPVFWAEYGYTVFADGISRDLDEQGRHYQNMLRMVLESGANGHAAWWYPGGFRVGENSDYGIIEQDGSPRPAALALREYSGAVRTGLIRRLPDTWITFDREAHCRGYSRVLDDHRDEYARALDQGRKPGARTVATGTTSASVPDEAVGGTPWTGRNPHKYLNAEFCSVQVRESGGLWREVEADGRVEVPRGRRIELRVAVANTGEPRWLADGNGAVRLRVEAPGGPHYADLQGDVDRYGRVAFAPIALGPSYTETTVSVRMEVRGRGGFGQKMTVVLRPR
ncbi:MAG TPA: hypothetical protein PLD23_05620 [Armatimonadota bacterium]|nr:hypothetical protein [Armatimonadota bacterium]